MKKFLALALILTLALSVSVFAAETTDRVVGDDPYTGTSYEDGWTATEWTAAGSLSSDIQITVEAGQVESRYAVDVVYESFSINVTGGKLVWNVNTLSYDSIGTVTDELNITNSPIKIYNYSDKPIYVKPTVTDAAADADHVTITASTQEKFEVAKATVGTGAVETRRGFQQFTVSVTSTNWNAVAEYYADELSDTTTPVVIGTISLQISKD